MRGHDDNAHTLVATERALAPLSLTLSALCPTLALVGFACLRDSSSGLWLALAILSLAATLSNARYLRGHRRPSVGMIPLALASLFPTTLLAAGEPKVPPALRVAAALCAALLGSLLLTLAYWIARMRLSYRLHPQVKPDATLVVLGGAVRKGQPSKTLALRLEVAVRLWNECPSRTIVVSGGTVPDGSTTEADVMAAYLLKAGVRRSSLLLEREARNTQENVRLSLALLHKGSRPSQVCVVSSDYHLFRALRYAHKMGASLTPIPAPTPRSGRAQQWCREALTLMLAR